MSIDLLKKNIEQEKNLIRKLNELLNREMREISLREKRALEDVINSISNQIKILNNSLPLLIKNISAVKKLPNEEEYENKELISIKYEEEDYEKLIAIKKSDKEAYLKQLHISDTSIKNLSKRKEERGGFKNEFKKPNQYIRISNKLFGQSAKKMVREGKFKSLGVSLRKGNFTFLTSSYVSMMFFTTIISLFVGFFIFLFFMLFIISFTSPFIYIIDFKNTNILMRFLQLGWIIVAVPILTFLAIYLYPSTEKSTIEQQIDYELPFVTIQMAAIAGANIEPSNIFRIIALGKEYPYIKVEAKKLMNQINLYGYDLINALRNVAMASPSKSWAELLNGISITIISGGNISQFLNKRAESLLFEYRLRRERATKSAETFMDIYISTVITAPMLMMLLLIMMSMSGIGLGIPIPVLTMIVISIVAFINIIFLAVLHINKRRI